MFYVADKEGHPEAPKLNHVYVSLGSLTSEIPDAPVAHMSYEERVRWYQAGDALPKFRGKTNEDSRGASPNRVTVRGAAPRP